MFRKILKFIFIFLITLLIIVIAYSAYKLRDRNPGYEVNIGIKAKEPKEPLKVGFAALPITPNIEDTWNDVNNDAKYKEEDGDSYNDNNNNGKFDPYWIAGFSNKRAANGVHDDVWARAVVFDDDNTRLALVSIDAIGFMHDDVIDIREMIPEELNIDYTLVASTHTHESNDLMGIWGPGITETGVNAENMAYVKSQSVKAIKQAVGAMKPANLHIAQNLQDADILVEDSRDPQVKDPAIRLIKAVDAETEKTLGILSFWANHPETVWSKNLLISSDFPHYFREYLEHGIYNGDSLVKEGVGAEALYFNGAIGGLMTTRKGVGIKDPFSDSVYYEPSFAKVDVQGKRLALIALESLENPDTIINEASISLQAKTIDLQWDNETFGLAVIMGLLDRGMSGYKKVRSEVAAFKIGPVSFIAVPGELYPEILNGGIENPDGADFKIDPIETPPLRSLMPGDYKFMIGLANDEIGYIIPKSQWDVEPPYTYGDTGDGPYGEENSFGPETAPTIYREIQALLAELN
ncbi:MAG: neutral/alkaline non-lysosomal ceramidase N-terminal domain-containing protein [Bacteroidota bacterium]